MNIGKLVRQKMKELSADQSGQYLDSSGRHFCLAPSEGGYTVSYGGEAKREIEVSKDQARKLVAASKKLYEEGDEKRLAKSTKDILAIANHVESVGAGFFSRNSDGSMTINFRVAGRSGSDSAAAYDNARKVAQAIGPQAGEPKTDRMSGNVVLTIKNAYGKNLAAGDKKFVFTSGVRKIEIQAASLAEAKKKLEEIEPDAWSDSSWNWRIAEKQLAAGGEKKYSVDAMGGKIDFILYQDGYGDNGGSWRAKAANGKGRDVGPFKTISALKSYLQSMRKVDFE